MFYCDTQLLAFETLEYEITQSCIERIAVHNSMEEVSNKEGFLAPPYPPPYQQPLSSQTVACFVPYSPGYQKRVVGEGMPQDADPSQMGDLVVEFRVQFPQTMNPQQKSLIRQALL